MREIKSFKLEVNNQNVATKRFVRDFIGNSLLGQIESLRLKDSKVQKIDLQIEFEMDDI